MRRRGRRRHRSRWVVPALLGVSLTLMAAGAAGFVLAPAGPAASAATVPDLNGAPIHVEPGTLPTADQQERMQAQSDLGVRFRVPDVGLDVPLGALNSVGGVVTPPGFRSAYLLRDHGTTLEHPEAGTVYVALHSVRGGGVGPGNYLIDVTHGTSSLRTGTRIDVGSLRYAVTGWSTVDKKDLPTDRAVWADTPDRLVIVTCLQQPSGAPSTQNLVVVAQRQP